MAFEQPGHFDLQTGMLEHQKGPVLAILEAQAFDADIDTAHFRVEPRKNLGLVFQVIDNSLVVLNVGGRLIQKDRLARDVDKELRHRMLKLRKGRQQRCW